MSENKLVEFLDELREFPDRLFSKGQMGIFWKVDPISMLTEIKGIVELYEKSEEFTRVYLPIPRDTLPGDDLVGMILAIGVIFQQNVHDKCEAMSFSWTVEQDKAKDKIRKLLQGLLL